MAIGNQIKELRQLRGLSQESLAFEAGLSPSTVARIEIGQTMPRGSTLVEISKALEISLEELRGEKGPFVVRQGDPILEEIQIEAYDEQGHQIGLMVELNLETLEGIKLFTYIERMEKGEVPDSPGYPVNASMKEALTWHKQWEKLGPIKCSKVILKNRDKEQEALENLEVEESTKILDEWEKAVSQGRSFEEYFKTLPSPSPEDRKRNQEAHLEWERWRNANSGVIYEDWKKVMAALKAMDEA